MRSPAFACLCCDMFLQLLPGVLCVGHLLTVSFGTGEDNLVDLYGAQIAPLLADQCATGLGTITVC